MQDIWEFKDPQYPIYPTEKNYELLSSIIKTSSNQDSIVLDCFCGSGTTLKAAHDNGRKWIGIDQSKVAIMKTIEKLSSVKSNLMALSPDFQLLGYSGSNIDKNSTIADTKPDTI